MLGFEGNAVDVWQVIPRLAYFRGMQCFQRKAALALDRCWRWGPRAGGGGFARLGSKGAGKIMVTGV